MRKAFLVITWIILAGIATQVLLIGLGIFYSSTFSDAHMGLGWMFGHLGALLFIVGFFARMGRTLTILNVIAFVLFAALPFLAGSRQDSPLVAGLHPIIALTVFSLTGYISLRLKALIASAPTGQPAGPRLVPPPTQAVVQGRVLQNTER